MAVVVNGFQDLFGETKTMKLLLPLDVTQDYQASCRDYFAELKRLVPLWQADVLVLYVAEPTDSLEALLASMGKPIKSMSQELELKANEVLTEAQAALKDVCRSVRVQVVHGHPAQMILAVAKEEATDLVAIPARHHSFASSILLGHTAANVLKDFAGTVLILRENPATSQNALRALVAIDGSEQSFAAMKSFVKQFEVKQKNIELTILTVVNIVGLWKFVSPVGFVAAIEDNLNMAAETILAQSDKILSEFEIQPAQMIIRTGEAAQEILKAAQDINADIIVVGALGKSTVKEFFLGSVSRKLSVHATCSTVVVK